ncbi:M12 family metallopeptidase [Sphaerisporangium sp. TRM90804]|uniref:M12 family metallopeptidase n=1 Tax=Sphaerisporangium sp. TRM90804 TaxID=3031113 RepID=UPI002448099C|nr:M12 family metallopeptidase [Sphaerisporangium sp. TRM90804]MDH2429587.1 M12 family metallopeptidase [Sphaerisporangium sp. TRM90804]
MKSRALPAIVLLALAAGAAPAAAEEDPLERLWRQQAQRPSLSITTTDVTGEQHTIGYVDIDGHAVTEGDIVIGTAAEAASGKLQLPGIFPEVAQVRPGPIGRPGTPAPAPPARMALCDQPPAGAATTKRGALWPGGKVPYVLAADLPATALSAVADAMKDYHDHTCVRFVPRTSETNYLSLFPGAGCYSYVGRVDAPAQEVSIGRGCERKGIVIHELMHAIGFYHEHSRSDRDSAVTVHLENVMRGYEEQFQKLSPEQNRLFGDLDYGSVMLYGRTFFSSNGQDTLVPRKPAVIGQRTGFSPVDLTSIRALYGCPEPVIAPTPVTPTPVTPTPPPTPTPPRPTASPTPTVQPTPTAPPTVGPPASVSPAASPAPPKPARLR